MAKPVANVEVEKCLREILGQEGFQLNLQRAHGQTGVDMVATNSNGDAYHIEVVGYKAKGPTRAKDFYEGFFRIVSRLNDGAKHCILALSQQAAIGLPARAKQHRVAWLRIATAFPELEIWLVDTQERTYGRTTWGEWAEG